MYKWYLPTFSEILALDKPNLSSRPRSVAQRRVKAEREWFGAIAALNQLLQQAIASTETPGSVKGILLSGPLPVLTQPDLVNQVATWTFTVGNTGQVSLRLPAAMGGKGCETAPPTLPLLPDDPLAAEPFCLVLTSHFSLAMALGETEDGTPAFLFSFEPEVVWQVWRSLQARLMLVAPQPLSLLNGLVEQFPTVAPDYRTVMQFSRLMLANLSDSETEGKRVHIVPKAAQTGAKFAAMSFASSFSKPWQAKKSQKKGGADTELLQAIAHEVRTPLTTIRTLTRLLLKRKELGADVIKRLKMIDQECTEQIDRFSLIFKAVELETTDTSTPLSPLAPICLAQVFQQNTPRWQQQAQQHRHTLDIILPQKMPMVVTDPTMLDQALTGLIDRITHSLPPGSHIEVQVTLAGHQLKLQFKSQSQADCSVDGKDKYGFAPVLKSLGQLLMFQPETGNLSLSMPVTKNFFQALGGKLIVRQHPQQGEVLTIFLPLDNRRVDD
ncbi:MAG: HAMP domain-containing histidine kinase [Timaviella obliquedivisa GSE-PSE-MK23-08B]|nr:HAMP domain-containing histidine kinase [Timaviella obliquedivisa GSE-PSE-MK23-08B]